MNVALPPAAIFADPGDGPVTGPVAVLVPPNVRDDGVTLFTCSPPVLFTVITTVMVWPGVTVAGVADIDDVSIAAANTKLVKKVRNKLNTNIIEIILLFIKITDIIEIYIRK